MKGSELRRPDPTQMPAAGKPSGCASGPSGASRRPRAPAAPGGEGATDTPAAPSRYHPEPSRRSGHAPEVPGVPSPIGARGAFAHAADGLARKVAGSEPVPPAPRRGDWFSALFGFAETDPEVVHRFLQVYYDERSEDVKLVSSVNRREYSVGRFDIPSLRALHSQLRELGARARTVRGSIRFRNELGDVSEKHALRENRFATFQVASQFNCLEFVHQNITPEQGVSRYVDDKTQGPACAIACGPATVYRNYFCPMRTRDGREQVGQTADCMINNLEGLSRMLGDTGGRFFKVKGGYTMSSEGQLGELNQQIANIKRSGKEADLREAICIGVQEDVQVTSAMWGRVPQEDPEHKVTQVFVSACAVDYNHGTKPQSWMELGTLVLDATYEATLLVAIMQAVKHNKELGSNKVFLTAVGGGVFGNPMPWISAAIAKALHKFAEYDLEVVLVTYAGKVDPAFRALEEKYPGRGEGRSHGHGRGRGR